MEAKEVEVAQFLGPEALRWAQQAEPDLDENGDIVETDELVLPALPFRASAMVDKSLGRTIRGWFKKCLSTFKLPFR